MVEIVLQSDTETLDEVVVTAMGLSREKKALGYALQEVKSEEITQAAQLNVANALSGKIAGIQITSQGGQVGASQNIVIRGNSSFGNNAPLIVVDGVPVQNDNGTGSAVNLGSGLNDINPEDIESISVLKGGSAALYGMRAGNGVILITTKSGKKIKAYRYRMTEVLLLTKYTTCQSFRINMVKGITEVSSIGKKEVTAILCLTQILL